MTIKSIVPSKIQLSAFLIGGSRFRVIIENVFKWVILRVSYSKLIRIRSDCKDSQVCTSHLNIKPACTKAATEGNITSRCFATEAYGTSRCFGTLVIDVGVSVSLTAVKIKSFGRLLGCMV
jgi:hypothetical protein